MEAVAGFFFWVTERVNNGNCFMIILNRCEERWWVEWRGVENPFDAFF